MNDSSIPQPEPHLDTEAVYALLDGRLDPPTEQTAEAHLWRCDRCRALREECAALLSSLRWYAADPPAPPEGYWEEFWRRIPLRSRRRHRLLPALALAASIAVLLMMQPKPEPRSDGPVAVGAVSDPVAPSQEWASEYRRFEEATVAVGSVDPLSKGIVLATLAEAR